MNKKQMQQNIEDYEKQIKTINEFVTAVRQIPGNFIGPLGNQGFLNMFREVYQNSIDEMIKKMSPCNHVNVTYDERTNTATVEDNGRGIPFNSMIRIYTDEYTSSNYTKKKGEYSSGLHGLGAKVTNALSTIFTVESYILGEARRVEFHEGRPWEQGVIKIPNKNNKQGTIVSFRPSYEVMGEITSTVSDVLSLVKMILFLTDIGSSVTFTGIYKDGKTYTEEIVNEDKLISYLILQTTTPLIEPILISHDTGEMKAEIAFTFDSSNISEEKVIGFANLCPTVNSSTHIVGFIDGVSRFFRDYMNKVFLSGSKKKNKLIVCTNDVKAGLIGIVSAFHIKPNFTGQAKEILSNQDLYYFVRDLTGTALDEWSKANPRPLQKLCKYFKDIAEVRVKSDEEKIKISDKCNSSSLNGGLPKKFIAPILLSKRVPGLEFVIVEGDSAGGSAKNSRNKNLQGILPIKGKIPNALTTKRAKFLGNDEVKAIINITGGGYGKDFDLTKVPWEKIIFMPDADPDGAHIATLLLKLVMTYMRPLIEAGRVYKAVPPLYGLKGKKKNEYFTTRMDWVAFLQESFTRENTIGTVRGNALTKNEILSILYNNIDYTYEVDTIANRYSVDPLLLELVVVNRNLSFNDLYKVLKSHYRFIELENINGTIVIKGLAGEKYQTLFLNDKLDYDLAEIKKLIDKADKLHYNINGETRSLYELMKMFENSAPKNKIRYKGLGEMDPSQLAESTLLPNSGRTLIRYTVESAQKEIDMIRFLEDNKQELIKDMVATRNDLLG